MKVLKMKYNFKIDVIQTTYVSFLIIYANILKIHLYMHICVKNVHNCEENSLCMILCIKIVEPCLYAIPISSIYMLCIHITI